MTIVFLPRQKKQQYVAGILGVLALAGGFLAWYGYFREGTVSLSQYAAPLPRMIEVDFTIFDNRVFQELGSPEPFPPSPISEERRNPFAPSP